MNLDSDRGMNTFRTEACIPSSQPGTIYCDVRPGGYMESGGQSMHRQDGDQFVLRCRKVDFHSPAVHDTLITTNFGTLEVKKIDREGDLWVLRCVGTVAGRVDL